MTLQHVLLVKSTYHLHIISTSKNIYALKKKVHLSSTHRTMIAQYSERPAVKRTTSAITTIYIFSRGMAQIQTCTHSDSIVPRVKIQLWLVDKPWWIHASIKGLVCFGEMKQQFVPCEQSPHWLEALDMGWRSPPIIWCFTKKGDGYASIMILQLEILQIKMVKKFQMDQGWSKFPKPQNTAKRGTTWQTA